MRTTRMNPAAAALTLGLAMTALLSGCTNPDTNEFKTLVCEVEAINGGAPMTSAYVNVGDPMTAGDETYPIDWATVSFHARPYSNWTVLAEDSPRSYFHVTEYDLIWTALPGQTQGEPVENFSTYGNGVDALVPREEGWRYRARGDDRRRQHSHGCGLSREAVQAALAALLEQEPQLRRFHREALEVGCRLGPSQTAE